MSTSNENNMTLVVVLAVAVSFPVLPSLYEHPSLSVTIRSGC